MRPVEEGCVARHDQRSYGAAPAPALLGGPERSREALAHGDELHRLPGQSCPLEKERDMPSSEVMHKWKGGKLHSGSKGGPKVKNRKQAVAIMLSEKRNEGKHGGKYKEGKK